MALLILRGCVVPESLGLLLRGLGIRLFSGSFA